MTEEAPINYYQQEHERTYLIRKPSNRQIRLVLTIPKLLYIASTLLALGSLISAAYTNVYLNKISPEDWKILSDNIIVDPDQHNTLTIGLTLTYVAACLHICHLLMQPCVCMGGDKFDCLCSWLAVPLYILYIVPGIMMIVGMPIPDDPDLNPDVPVYLFGILNNIQHGAIATAVFTFLGSGMIFVSMNAHLRILARRCKENGNC